MDLDIRISLSQPLEPMSDAGDISYSDSRNLPLPTNTKHKEYTVKVGDTVATLAEMCGITPVQMAEWLRDEYGTDMLYIGQEVKLPTKTEEV